LPKSPQAPTRSRTPGPVIFVLKEKADQPDRATVKVLELKGILSALYSLNSNSVICSMPDVVIIGASSGIGLAACEALIRRGFRVFGKRAHKGRCGPPNRATGSAPGVEWPLSRRDTPCFPAN
jgi:hypothetical protein